MVSLSLVLSPEMFPMHQMAYSLTSMCCEACRTLIRIGMPLFSTKFMTNLLSLLAKLVRHQIASNCNFGESCLWAKSNSLGTKPLSTVCWMGGFLSKESRRLRPIVEKICMIFLSDKINSVTLLKSVIYRHDKNENEKRGIKWWTYLEHQTVGFIDELVFWDVIDLQEGLLHRHGALTLSSMSLQVIGYGWVGLLHLLLFSSHSWCLLLLLLHILSTAITILSFGLQFLISTYK